MRGPVGALLLAGLGAVGVGWALSTGAEAQADEAPAPVGADGPLLVLIGDHRVGDDTDAERLRSTVGDGLRRVIEPDPARWPAAVDAAAAGRPVGLVVAYAGLDTLAGPEATPGAGVRALATALSTRSVPLQVIRAPEGPAVPLDHARELRLRADLSALRVAWEDPTGWAPSGRPANLWRLPDVSLGDGAHPTTGGRLVIGGWIAAELRHLWHAGAPRVSPEGPRATDLVTWSREPGARVELGPGSALPAPGRDGWVGPGGTFTVHPHEALGPLLVSFDGWVVGAAPELRRGEQVVESAPVGQSVDDPVVPLPGAARTGIQRLRARVGTRGWEEVTLRVPPGGALWIRGFTVVGGGVDPDHEGGRSRFYRVVHPAEPVPALDLLRGEARWRGPGAAPPAIDAAAVLRDAGQPDCPPASGTCASGARWVLPGQKLLLDTPGLGALALPDPDGTRPGTRLELGWTHWGPAGAELRVEVRQAGELVLEQALGEEALEAGLTQLRCVLDASKPVQLVVDAPADGGAWLVGAARVRTVP